MTKTERQLNAMSREELLTEAKRMTAILNAPVLEPFHEAVRAEAAHQAWQWEESDQGKQPQDWFWLLGYLSGKALRAHIDGDRTKALHHTVSSAAVTAHWHQAIIRQLADPSDREPNRETNE